MELKPAREVGLQILNDCTDITGSRIFLSEVDALIHARDLAVIERCIAAIEGAWFWAPETLKKCTSALEKLKEELI